MTGVENVGVFILEEVPKRRHIKFRRREITQKKAYNIQKTAKVWNQEYSQYMYNVALRRFRATIVTVENQEALDILSVYL